MTLNSPLLLLQFLSWSTELPFENVFERVQVIVAAFTLEFIVLVLCLQNRFGQSEVSNLQLVVLFFVDKDVFRLDVSMNLAVLVDVA